MINQNLCFKIVLFSWTGICSRVAFEKNIDVYIDSVTELVRKCIEDVVPNVTIEDSIRTKLKVRTSAFNHSKVTGNMDKYKQSSYVLRNISNRQNISTET